MENYFLPARVEGLFDVQSDIARNIAAELDVTLSARDRTRLAARQPTSQKAYDAYLLGNSYAQRAQWAQAGRAYQEAVAADPKYFPAWAALAQARAHRYFAPPGAVLPQAVREPLERARALAPGTPEVELAAGVVALFVDQDFDTAVAHFDRTLEARENAVAPRHFTAIARTLSLQLDRARTMARRVVLLDPLNPTAVYQLGFIEAEIGNFRQARSYYDRAVALAPAVPGIAHQRWQVYLWGLGEVDTAGRIVDATPVPALRTDGRLWLAYVARDLETMETLLQSLPDGDVAHHRWRARLCRLNGDGAGRRAAGGAMRLAAARDLDHAAARQRPPIFLAWRQSTLAVAEAISGQAGRALETIDRATASAARQNDRLNTIMIDLNRARLHALLDQPERAIETLRRILVNRTPRIVTPHRLRLDPDFDALRGHPGFEALLPAAPRTSAGR